MQVNQQHNSTTAQQHNSTTAQQHNSTTAQQHNKFNWLTKLQFVAFIQIVTALFLITAYPNYFTSPINIFIKSKANIKVAADHYIKNILVRDHSPPGLIYSEILTIKNFLL